MKTTMTIRMGVAALLAAAPLQGQVQVSGNAGLETRGFFQAPAWPGQERHAASVSLQPELYWSWDGGAQSLTVEPFLRWDAADEARSHVDLRSLSWERVWRDWEVRAGLRTVFWGVTESQHLVDVINQTDAVENPDGEDKLGQPMINVAAVRDWGTVDVFVLPGFRPRTFPGADGRLRSPLVVDPDAAVYESSRGRGHVDVAARWQHYIGGFDAAVSWFHGTGREPRLVPEPRGDVAALVPHYDQIDQVGIDLQYTTGPWLWKAESVTRTGGPSGRYWASTAGFERTAYQVLGSDADVGILLEHLWDSRGTNAPTPFQNDVFVGARLALNDVQSSSLLAGSIIDLEAGSGMYLVEGERRLGDAFRITLEARGVWRADDAGLLSAFRRDDHITVEVSWWW